MANCQLAVDAIAGAGEHDLDWTWHCDAGFKGSAVSLDEAIGQHEFLHAVVA